jgi:tetratricopeptide (TPR) repeat protein
LGIALYKTGDYENSIKSFGRAESINSADAQLQYNLGLASFKNEQYNSAVDHFKKCTDLDFCHPYAYNNLAFIYNMHTYYTETINMYKLIKSRKHKKHNCYRHLAFAWFKKGELPRSIKKIRKAIRTDPKDADNWVVWGLIMRTCGNYWSAQHKFQKALKLDPNNETAQFELDTVERMIELDQQIPID